MAELETRRLGRSKMMVKALGLGGGHLAGPEQSDEVAIDLIRGAIDRGINFVDTSPDYGLSERRIGMALAGGWRDKAYLQTKVGSHPAYLRDWSQKATVSSLENSFKTLDVEYVDSVLIHGPRHCCVHASRASGSPAALAAALPAPFPDLHRCWRPTSRPSNPSPP